MPYGYGYKQSYFESTPFQDWLYEPWDEQKYKQYKLLAKVPILNDYMDYLLDLRGDYEYFNRYGMDYSDIHDPRKLSQSSSSNRLVGNAYRMISRNINQLYK